MSTDQKGMMHAAQALAATAVDLFENTATRRSTRTAASGLLTVTDD
jgi:hypothetical protein